jgi:hypothetical protein
VLAGVSDPARQGLAGDPEGAGGLGDVVDLGRMRDRGDTALVDNVSDGHGALSVP